MTAPSIARTVHYTLTEADADRINKRREEAKDVAVASGEDGVPVHFGNEAHAGQVLPLIVVRVNPGGHVNGQVFLDGNDTHWVASVAEGDGRGQWSWPPRV